MFIRRFRLCNFSSFAETDWVDLSSGINLIVGQNNTGKSAILRIFEQNWPENYHRNSSRFRVEDRSPQQAWFDICVSKEELWRAVRRCGPHFNWPISGPVASPHHIAKASSFLEKEVHLFPVTRFAGDRLSDLGGPLHLEFAGPAERGLGLKFIGDQIAPVGTIPSREDSCLSAINEVWKSHVFVFQAQRYALGRSNFGREDYLLTNARNLAGILSKMQGEQGAIFEKLVSHLREIFSTVRNLSVTPASDGFEIRVWPTENRFRAELSFPLDDCGTGVSQVIAILAVAMTFERAIIIIDEINTFLHPAAAKALVRILRTDYAHHQYIITTHSPDVLSAASPSTVHLVRKKDFDSNIERIDLQKVDDLRGLANEIGVSMTDVFAAERIVWVEGPTEEICFPYIYKQRKGELPNGVVLSSVVAPGDFNANVKRKELIFQIYDRLSKIAAPLVKSAAFHFDRETLTDSEIQELRRAAKDRVAFLPRRHLECYLLNPAAIAAFINSYLPENERAVGHQDVRDCLCRIGGDRKYKADSKWNNDPSDLQWLSEVDAANLIKDVCYELSENRISFSKNRHSFDILKRILENDPKSLDELTDYVKDLFEMVTT